MSEQVGLDKTNAVKLSLCTNRRNLTSVAVLTLSDAETVAQLNFKEETRSCNLENDQ